MSREVQRITTEQIYDLVDRKTGELRKDMQSLETKIDGHFLTKEEFEAKFNPIQKLVYGVVTIVGTAVIGAIMTFVLKK
jgi:thiosulfate reductase cytochrome b subunit